MATAVYQAKVPLTVMYKLNEQKIQLQALTDDTGAFVNTAVVKATMKDATGATVAEINNVTLASIDLFGNYSFTVPATFNPAEGLGSVLTITATLAGVAKYEIEKQVVVAVRR